MLIIPLQAVPSQSLQTVLNGQSTQINVYQKQAGLYMDVYLNNNLVIAGVLCEDDHLIIRNTYFGYSGDFIFDDTQGTSDPTYIGLGSRFLLYYLLPAELAALDLPAGVS